VNRLRVDDDIAVTQEIESVSAVGPRVMTEAPDAYRPLTQA